MPKCEKNVASSGRDCGRNFFYQELTTYVLCYTYGLVPTRIDAMIQLSALTKAFGDRVLLDHVTWQISDRERVGLCGPNGSGKTTLLRMMAGLEDLDSGAILKPATLTVGYLPQDGLSHAGRSVFDEAKTAFDELLA